MGFNSHNYSLHLITTLVIITTSFVMASSSPFEFLKHLEGTKKGDKNQNILHLRKYLQRFGYLNTNPTKQTLAHINNVNNDETFDDLLETALKTYQRNFNLEPTGNLDPKTISKMSTPRCAVSDFFDGKTRMTRSKSLYYNNNNRKLLGNVVSRYAFFSGEPIWPAEKLTLTYGFAPGTPKESEEAVGRAFQTWAGKTRFEFARAQSGATRVDIRVSFERGDHGDEVAFDGAGGVLAHAFSPTDGRLHFDADEEWSSVGVVAGAYDVETVGLHEIGHVLGLMHSSVEGAIMYPQIGAGVTKGLHEDDIAGINDLYNVAF